MRAAVTLVAERGTAAVSLSEIAEAADVTRKVVYQHFGDRDALLLAAGLDLASRELLPTMTDHLTTAGGQALDAREPVLAMARHFADRRAFYRALMTGPTAFAVDQGLTSLILPVNRDGMRTLYGDRLTRGRSTISPPS